MAAAKRFDWLRMIFRAQPSDDAARFVALPPEPMTDHLTEILERLQEAERKHSAFGVLPGNQVR
jgi:hypothetical protein